MKYNVISPDGIPISVTPFNSLEEARAAIPRWCQYFSEQGYYLTAEHVKIPLEDLPECMTIEPVDS